MACMTGAVRRKARVAQVGRIFITAGRSVSVTAVTGGCEVGEAGLEEHTRSGPLAGEIPGLKPVMFGVRCHRAEARCFHRTTVVSCRLSGKSMTPYRAPLSQKRQDGRARTVPGRVKRPTRPNPDRMGHPRGNLVPLNTARPRTRLWARRCRVRGRSYGTRSAC